MITKKDLDEAIAECNGVRNPRADTCIKLAAYYTIKEHLYPETHCEQAVDNNGRFVDFNKSLADYSFNAPSDTVQYSGDGDFAEAIRGKNSYEMWAVMDELMDTLKIINPRLYDGVMRKII